MNWFDIEKGAAEILLFPRCKVRHKLLLLSESCFYLISDESEAGLAVNEVIIDVNKV